MRKILSEAGLHLAGALASCGPSQLFSLINIPRTAFRWVKRRNELNHHKKSGEQVTAQAKHVDQAIKPKLLCSESAPLLQEKYHIKPITKKDLIRRKCEKEKQTLIFSALSMIPLVGVILGAYYIGHVKGVSQQLGLEEHSKALINWFEDGDEQQLSGGMKAKPEWENISENVRNIAIKLEEGEKSTNIGKAPGVICGEIVLLLQKKLAATKKIQEKEQIAQKIADLFEGCSNHYPMLKDLTDLIDSSEKGLSNLNQLVGEDLIVGEDYSYCHRIIKSINEGYKKGLEKHSEIMPKGTMIYSDIDDTIKGTLNDRQSRVKGFYPGMMTLYKVLGEHGAENLKGPNLTFLSARPKGLKKHWVKDLIKAVPKNHQFYSLFGSTKDIKKGIKHYSIGKLIKKLGFNQAAEDMERDAFVGFGLAKLAHINFDLLLRPHMRGVFFGDDGEGDVLCMLTKNMGTRSPIEDPRISEGYMEGGDSDQQVGNPTDRPLAIALAHAVPSKSRATVRPSVEYQKEYAEEFNTHLQENAAAFTLTLLKKGMLTLEEADQVIDECQEWLEGEGFEAPVDLEGISGSEAYRRELSDAIKAYDDLYKSSL